MFDDSTSLSIRRFLFLALVLIVSSGLSLAGKYCLDPPPVTSNDDFFTLGRIPQWHGDWTLEVDGEVELPLSLSLDELREYPQSHIEATLECDYSSGPPLLVGNAVWTGVSLRSLIEQAEPKPAASSVTFHALDGYQRGPFPLSEVLQKTDALVAYGMNSEPLPEIQGWPARIVLPGHTGNQWVRWLDRIEISSAPVTDSFRQWPIHARIMEPGYNAFLDVCPITIKGMVNAGEGKEIAAVQISTDDGMKWEDAQILTSFTANVWKHWQYVWKPQTHGEHTIFARVIDEDGNVQNEDRPYGWWGYKVVVNVKSGIDCVDPQRGDLNGDWHVDFADFSHLANQWLMTGSDLPADIMPGQGDEQVGFGDLAVIAGQWLNCFVPAVADPAPDDGQTDVGPGVELAWSPGNGAISCDVYLGIDACSVAAAGRDSQEFLGSAEDGSFALDRVLEPDTVYYWRVDQVGHRCTSIGETWSFKTTGDSTTFSE